MRSANLALRALLEAAALAALAWWGSSLGSGPTRVLLAIAFPLAAAAVWGTFNVPGDPSRSGRAPVEVSGLTRLLIEQAVLAMAILALFAVGADLLAFVFFGLVLVHYLLGRKRNQWLLAGEADED